MSNAVRKDVSYDHITDRSFTITITDDKTGESITDKMSLTTFKTMAEWVMGFLFIKCNIERLMKIDRSKPAGL